MWQKDFMVRILVPQGKVIQPSRAMILRMWHCKESPEVRVIKCRFLALTSRNSDWVAIRQGPGICIWNIPVVSVLLLLWPHFECHWSWVSAVSNLHSLFKCDFKGPAFTIRVVGPRTCEAVKDRLEPVPLLDPPHPAFVVHKVSGLLRLCFRCMSNSSHKSKVFFLHCL